MRKNPWVIFGILVFAFSTLLIFLIGSSAISLFGESPVKVTAKNSVLLIDLEGVIMDGKKFIKQLKKYSDNPRVKAIVININSPGGVVGPSQEINEEIKRVRQELKKPVVAVSIGMAASGAYYAAVAADKFVVAPGSMIGSIGVIMEFANLEKLYDWAKIQRYSITTGKYKDSGAEYRSMREDERALFQDMINDVYEQFVKAVEDGRGLKTDVVKAYADGRVFTGRKAVELGFADQVGTIASAVKLAASMAHIEKDYEVFEPPKHKPGILDILGQGDEDIEGKSSVAAGVTRWMDKTLRTQLLNKPLYIMPGAFE